MKDFHKITGARVSLHDLQFNETAGYPEHISEFCAKVQSVPGVRSKCVEADIAAFKTVCDTGLPVTYKCHGGQVYYSGRSHYRVAKKIAGIINKEGHYV